MTDKEMAIVVGSLLHEVGNIVIRGGSEKRATEARYSFMKNEVKIEDEDLLSCMILPHDEKLQGIPENAASYVVALARRITKDMEKRKQDEEIQGLVPLESIFGYLNGNHQKCYVHPIEGERKISKHPVMFKEEQYQNMLSELTHYLENFKWNLKAMNVFLDYLKQDWSRIPAAAGSQNGADISMYDHVKFTGAVAVCLARYFEENFSDETYAQLLENRKKWEKTDIFLLLSIDISGIQKFIYTISTDGALKSLRARSFYLEIVMEHLIDEILESLDIPRTNLLYSGGGHCYMLLPNTQKVLEVLRINLDQINQWFIEQFQTDLFVGTGMYACSPEKLCDVPEGSYKECFQNVSHFISEKKLHRYSVGQIQEMNRRGREGSGERECRICKRSGHLNEENECPLCATLIRIAKDILEKEYFSVLDQKEVNALPLPNGKYLVAENKNQFHKRIKNKTNLVRSYIKNRIDSEYHYATNIWVASYAEDATLEELALSAEGIDRIAVLRADVDNLGTTFVSGFSHSKDEASRVTLVRNSVLSRQLSWFFKYYLNELLYGKKVIVVYAGGDDLFIAGAWDEVVDVAIEVHRALQNFTQGALTISGGIGIYPSDYPIRIIAQETAELEDAAKAYDNGTKNAVAIFHDDYVFHWNVFIERVYGEKYHVLSEFFRGNEVVGKGFLYKILSLLRERKEKINFARYVYLLSRMEPGENSTDAQKKKYRTFSQKLYKWMNSEEDSRELIAAIYIFVYKIRDNHEGEEQNLWS